MGWFREIKCQINSWYWNNPCVDWSKNHELAKSINQMERFLAYFGVNLIVRLYVLSLYQIEKNCKRNTIMVVPSKNLDKIMLFPKSKSGGP